MYTPDITSATIFEENGKIYISYYTSPNDRTRFSTRKKWTKENRKEIEKVMYKLAQEHYTNSLPSDSKTLLKNIALEALRSTAGNRSQEVQDDYEGLLERSILPELGHLEVGLMLPMHFEKWKNKVIETGLSKSRFHKYWTTCSLIMSFLKKNRIISSNPLLDVERGSKNFKESPDNSARYYSVDEVNLMIEHATGWFKVYLMTMFYTLIRTSEGLALQWRYIDFNTRKITIAHSVKKTKLKNTKTSKIRVIDMPDALHKVLLEHYENRISDTFVFPSYKTLKPYYGSNSLIKNHLKPLLKKLNIEYKTLYSTRHSGASALANANVSLVIIQKLLGHSRVSTTDAYVRNSLIKSDEVSASLNVMYQ